MKTYTVYILASKKYGTLYTGRTENLLKRVSEHKNGLVEGFTKKYAVKQLVYFEAHEDPEQAALREKQIKSWKRDWKINLIERHNPHWDDLSNNLGPM